MIPPFCPRPGCPAHFEPPDEYWWQHAGSYATNLFGSVPRYRCKICHKGFSDQTFSIDYYAKRYVEYRTLIGQLSSCCGMRAMGRCNRVDKKTIENKLMRLSHQALGAQVMAMRRMHLCEHLVADGFQSFWVSQYYPNNIHLLAGDRSQFVYAYHGVSIRRSGTMSEKQKRRRAELERRYRADPAGIATSFSQITQMTGRLAASVHRRPDTHAPIFLVTDEHQTYPRVIRDDGQAMMLIDQGRLAHRRVSSRLPRTRLNPLFAVNYLDRQLRQDLAEHVRESTRFARSAHVSMERLSVYLLQHNFFKRYRINQTVDDDTRHATVAGVSEGFLRWMQKWLTRRRVFLSRLPVPRPFMDVWLRLYETPLGTRPPYLPRYALG